MRAEHQSAWKAAILQAGSACLFLFQDKKFTKKSSSWLFQAKQVTLSLLAGKLSRDQWLMSWEHWVFFLSLEQIPPSLDWAVVYLGQVSGASGADLGKGQENNGWRQLEVDTSVRDPHTQVPSHVITRLESKHVVRARRRSLYLSPVADLAPLTSAKANSTVCKRERGMNCCPSHFLIPCAA